MCLGISQCLSTLNLNWVTRDLLEGRFAMVGVLVRVGFGFSYEIPAMWCRFPQCLPQL